MRAHEFQSLQKTTELGFRGWGFIRPGFRVSLPGGITLKQDSGPGGMSLMLFTAGGHKFGV